MIWRKPGNKKKTQPSKITVALVFLGGFLTLHIGLHYTAHCGGVNILINDDFFCCVATTVNKAK